MVIGCSLVLIIGLFSRRALTLNINWNLGVDKKVLAYPTPAPKDLQDPDDEHSVNFTTVEKVWSQFPELKGRTNREIAGMGIFPYANYVHGLYKA